MKVRIGSIEICDVSLDELDELVKRYGNAAIQPASDGAAGAEKPLASNGKASGGAKGSTPDLVLLRKLVDAGSQGVPTSDIGDMLGRRGKATRGAARDWAGRVGFATDPDMDPFEEVRVGTQRGLRIKTSLLDIARAILG